MGAYGNSRERGRHKGVNKKGWQSGRGLRKGSPVSELLLEQGWQSQGLKSETHGDHSSHGPSKPFQEAVRPGQQTS